METISQEEISPEGSPAIAIKHENVAHTNDTIDLTGSANVVGTSNVTDIKLFSRPDRFGRSDNICIIMRGLPGSGKTVIVENIEKIEKKYSKPCKIFTFDEYFVTLDTQVSTIHAFRIIHL